MYPTHSTSAQKVHLITTGGTIDSYYDIDACTVFPLSESPIPAYLKKYIRLDDNKLQHTPICCRDNREIDEHDLSSIYQSILTNDSRAHVITHGTFTVFDSARKLKAMLGDNNRHTVVFTGAMWPLEGFSLNDAAFNLGASIMAAKCSAPGVYVVFFGEVYDVEAMESLHVSMR